jgi:hypothetical protein
VFTLSVAAAPGLIPALRVVLKNLVRTVAIALGWKTVESSGSKSVANCCKSTYILFLCWHINSLAVVKQPQVVETGGHVGVLRAKGLFPDLQRPLVKGPGLRVLALGPVKRPGAMQKQPVWRAAGTPIKLHESA